MLSFRRVRVLPRFQEKAQRPLRVRSRTVTLTRPLGDGALLPIYVRARSDDLCDRTEGKILCHVSFLVL